jgi:hypothetical protein
LIESSEKIAAYSKSFHLIVRPSKSSILTEEIVFRERDLAEMTAVQEAGRWAGCTDALTETPA